MKALSTRWILATALAIALAQTAFLCLLPPLPDAARWENLFRWDGAWYSGLLHNGYISRFPPAFYGNLGDNVAYFPAYPALAWLLGRLGLPDPAALAAVAILANIAFWAYFFLLCRRLPISLGSAAGGAGLVLCYYGSFFLGAAYAESLELAGFLGLVYFTDRYAEGDRRAWWLAALHGILCSGSRVTGIPLCLYPAFLGLARTRGQVRAAAPFLALTLASLLGACAFFAYCHFRFGYWDLYFVSQRQGWGDRVDLLLPLDPRTYFDPRRFRTDQFGTMPGRGFGQISAVVLVLALLGWLVAEGRAWRKNGSALLGFEHRGSLVVAAWGSFHAALARAGMTAFSGAYRYGLPLLVALVLSGLELHEQAKKGRPRAQTAWRFLLLALAVLSLAVQFRLAARFVTSQPCE